MQEILYIASHKRSDIHLDLAVGAQSSKECKGMMDFFQKESRWRELGYLELGYM